MKNFLGTGFFIGTNGFALTASHVIKDVKGTIAALHVHPTSNEWHGFLVEATEHHPVEDVALVKIEKASPEPLFEFDRALIHAGLDYFSFGYPTDALYQNLDNRGPFGTVLPNPDLVFTKGYVRRRVSWDLRIPGVKGKSFIELSSVAGSGCSGGPVFRSVSGKMLLMGVYVGERLTDQATSVSYATRALDISQWRPNILGRELLDET